MASCRVQPVPFDLQTAKPIAQAKGTPAKPTQDPKTFKPDATKFDWIRLKSDEWLKGEILSLRDGTFEFDSDELEELEMDWADVAEVRSAKVHTLLLEGRRSHTGNLPSRPRGRPR